MRDSAGVLVGPRSDRAVRSEGVDSRDWTGLERNIQIFREGEMFKRCSSQIGSCVDLLWFKVYVRLIFDGKHSR